MVIAHLEPFQQRYREITADPAYLAGVLREGAERVAPIANGTVRTVKATHGPLHVGRHAASGYLAASSATTATSACCGWPRSSARLGDWFYALAVYNLLLELTGSKAQAVGLAVVLQVLPSTFAAPTAGVLNDRISRKRIMIGADLARFFIVLGMLLVRTPAMVWLVYPLLLLETIGAAFFEPAHNSVIPNIVPENEVLAANTLASITWSFCLAAGASLGGVAAVWLGRDAVFVLNAFSFLLSAWLIRRMSFAEPHAADRPPLRARELVEFTPDPRGHSLHPPRSTPVRHRLRERAASACSAPTTCCCRSWASASSR